MSLLFLRRVRALPFLFFLASSSSCNFFQTTVLVNGLQIVWEERQQDGYEPKRRSGRILSYSVIDDHGVADPSTSSFSASSRRVLFQGGDVAFFLSGQWCVNTDQSSTEMYGTDGAHPTTPSNRLVLMNQTKIQGRRNGLGSFTGTQFFWNCMVPDSDVDDDKNNDDDKDNTSAIPILTRIKNFSSQQAILFEVEWPRGALNTTISDDENFSLSNFPLFLLPPSDATTTPTADQHATTSEQESVLPLSSILSWEGSFLRSTRTFATGPKGGPTVFYNATDPDLQTVIVASPFESGHFKTFTAGNQQDWQGRSAFAPGTSARITSLPPRFVQSFLMVKGPKRGGILAAIGKWGHIMRATRKASDKETTTPMSKFQKLRDVTLEKIGYQTDNGAMYCFCQDTNCSDTLIKEIKSLKQDGVPMGYLSFQGAGASTGRSQAAPWCVETWGMDGGLNPKHYPMNLVTFQRALQIPLQLYAPYFCPTTQYFDNGTMTEGHDWESVSSDTNLPGCKGFDFRNVQASQSKEFYGWFLDKGRKANMMSFETDFMNQNSNCVPDFFQSTVNAADEWLLGMATAAFERNTTIQWCYATPTDVLASLEMPAVTNFRVSFDFCYGHSWDIGESSLLTWALGVAPSKDTLWTTDNNRTATPGCAWTADHENSAAELHVVLALMSTGPVGISDAMGYTNVTLLKRIMAIDGTLLKPARPIVAVDSTFVDSTVGGWNDQEGYILGTSGAGRSWIFVSHHLTEPYPVTVRDFWPPLQLTPTNDEGKDRARERILAYRTFDGHSEISCVAGTRAVETGCVRIVSLPLDDSSLYSHILTILPATTASRNGSTDAESSEEFENFSATMTMVWEACRPAKSLGASGVRGWVLLGELDKYVPLSPVRFSDIACTETGGIIATVVGAPGESVKVSALRPTETLFTGAGNESNQKANISEQLQHHHLGQAQSADQDYEIVTRMVVFPKETESGEHVVDSWPSAFLVFESEASRID